MDSGTKILHCVRFLYADAWFGGSPAGPSGQLSQTSVPQSATARLSKQKEETLGFECARTISVPPGFLIACKGRLPLNLMQHTPGIEFLCLAGESPCLKGLFKNSQPRGD